jgi:uncharacterized cupin superfamily protein
MTEARIVDSEDGAGRVPEGDGWFVLNAKDARWIDGKLGKYTGFEGNGAAQFPQLGININILEPGEPMTMYHRENAQEDFLVLSGECIVIVDGQERPLKQWDLFHCPAGVDHAVVGAGQGPSLVLAVGSRTGDEDDGLVSPAHPAAQKHGAAVESETIEPKAAYERFTSRRTGYEEGWLPE